MNDQFDSPRCRAVAAGELAMAQSATRRGALKEFGVGLAGIALAALFTGQAHTADVYSDASVNVNGDGTAARPYWRITEAIERARLLRQTAAIPFSERIDIHVAPGAYLGSKESSVLNQNPRYEPLPILLNVPNLTLAGATVLTLDARGLPTGVVPVTETLLKTVDHTGSFGDSLILISRTTDGGIGNDVTVSGLRLDQPDALHNGTGIFVDRVSNFRIEGNVITHAFAGLTTQNASGTIEGNLTFDNLGPGLGYITGGSAALSAKLVITRNRAVNNEGGLMLTAVAFGYQPHIAGNDLEIVSQQATFDRDDLPETLLPTVVNNDLSDNRGFGVRLVCAPLANYLSYDPKHGIQGDLVATLRNNSINGNGHYGVSVDSAFVLRSNKRPDALSFAGTFEGNQLLGNGRTGFLFSFTYIGVAFADKVASDYFKYLQNSTFTITDLDGEAAGFDYLNPATDPLDGTVLNNTLIVNGTVIPNGTKVSPRTPQTTKTNTKGKL
jgi:hypothetical protein